MGSSSSTNVNYGKKLWPVAYTHEDYINNFSDRNKSLISYEIDEYMSLGKLSLINLLNTEEFKISKTINGYYKGVRQKYSGDLSKCCLITDNSYRDDNSIVHTCDPSTRTYNSTLCDDVLYSSCLQDNNNVKCKSWIRSVVELHKKHFDELLYFARQENNRNNNITKIFLQALIDYNNDDNNYSGMLNEIIESYSNNIKANEYKCAYPDEYIKQLEKNMNVPKECWYKECVLSESYKLKIENINKRKTCKLLICDININKINISNQDVQIICQNTYNSNIDLKNVATNIDKDTYFFIPTFNNTLIPVLVLLSFLSLKL